VTLGSDDPPYFGATIGGEYRVCAERMRLDHEALLSITRTAIDAAFCDGGLKASLLQRMEG
jgi:adenosine deaminase